MPRFDHQTQDTIEALQQLRAEGNYTEFEVLRADPPSAVKLTVSKNSKVVGEGTGITMDAAYKAYVEGTSEPIQVATPTPDRSEELKASAAHSSQVTTSNADAAPTVRARQSRGTAATDA